MMFIGSLSLRVCVTSLWFGGQIVCDVVAFQFFPPPSVWGRSHVTFLRTLPKNASPAEPLSAHAENPPRVSLLQRVPQIILECPPSQNLVEDPPAGWSGPTRESIECPVPNSLDSPYRPQNVHQMLRVRVCVLSSGINGPHEGPHCVALHCIALNKTPKPPSLRQDLGMPGRPPNTMHLGFYGD